MTGWWCQTRSTGWRVAAKFKVHKSRHGQVINITTILTGKINLQHGDPLSIQLNLARSYHVASVAAKRNLQSHLTAATPTLSLGPNLNDVHNARGGRGVALYCTHSMNRLSLAFYSTQVKNSDSSYFELSWVNSSQFESPITLSEWFLMQQIEAKCIHFWLICY